MTVRAELDERGTEIYGANELILHPEPRKYALFGKTGRHVDSDPTWRVVTIPSTFDLTADKLSLTRWQLEVVGKDQVEVSRFSPSSDGESELVRTEVYEGSDIESMNVLNRTLTLPGMHVGEEVTATLSWHRDLPLIGRIRRGWAEFKRAARFEDVPLEQG